jgi:DNA-binding SARP family transcriptional activator/predicted ATPase
MASSLPTVWHDTLIGVPGDRGEPIVVGTPAWYTWLASATAFVFIGHDGHFTARTERPSHGRGGWYWKAYRRRGGRLRRSYLGLSASLTFERLRQAAAALSNQDHQAKPPEPDRRGGRTDGLVTGSSRIKIEGPADETLIEPSSLSLRLLGDFSLVYDGEPVMDITSARMRSLLAYLALHRETPQPRQQLAFLFWPDSTEAQARNNLRQLLHQLRHAWPASDRCLGATTSTLFWRRGVQVHTDVAAFEHAVALADNAERRADQPAARAALEHAAGLCRADFLSGHYEEWILREREWLRQRYCRTLDRLIALLEGQREYATTIDYAQRRLQHDPLDEETYRCLMRLHALNGDRTSALRVYRTCAALLEEELGVEPSPATREAYQRLEQLGPASPIVPPLVTDVPLPLVGRQHEWTQVQAAWRRAARGEAHLLLIAGEAGIGKSRLAEELLAWAGQQGLAAARTRAYAAEGRLSYAPVADWLRSAALRPALSTLDTVWLGEVARLLPELLSERPDLPHPAPLTEHWQRQRFYQGLARAAASAAQPLLLVLDDLQWCDHDTLSWLHFLLRFDRRARLLVVVTARTEEVDAGDPLSTWLADVRRAGWLSEITLGPLDAPHTAKLASYVAGGELDQNHAGYVYHETEGNPLFVVETVRAGLSTANRLPASDERQAFAVARFDQPPPSGSRRLPPTVHAVIATRLSQLSEAARELTCLAATIGRAFTLDVLRLASNGDEDRLVHALDELWRRRVVREDGAGACDFAHDKIREVAYAQVSAGHRRLLHHRVAQALEQVHANALDPVSAQVAAHYAQAGVPDLAATYYRRAAEVAQRVGANEEAISLLHQGLALLGQSQPSKDRDARELALQTALGVSLVATKGYGAAEVMGVYERSRRLCQQLGQPPSPPVLRALATASITHTHFRQAHDLGDQLLSLAERDRDPVLLVEAHYVLAMALFWTGALGPSQSHLEQALAHYAPRRSATHISLYSQDAKVVCLIRQALNLWLLGNPEQAARRQKQSLALAQRLTHPFTLGYALAWDALLQNQQRNVQATRAQAEAVIALSREHGFKLWLAMGTILRGWALAEQGRRQDEIEAGIALMRDGLAAFRATGSVYKRPYFLGLLAEQYGRLGNVERGLTLIAEALAMVERTGERWCEADLHRCKGELMLARHDAGGAEVAFQRVLDVARYQGAKAIERRAATRLARLRQHHGSASRRS